MIAKKKTIVLSNPGKFLIVALGIAVTWFVVGGCSSPAGPQIEVTGNNNVINTTDNDAGNDINGGGCCDDEGDFELGGECYSVPSCTQVPCNTCSIFGGWRECQTSACTATE